MSATDIGENVLNKLANVGIGSVNASDKLIE